MQADIATQNARIARQLIFDARKEVVAYQLLFRSSEQNAATLIDSDHATADVLLNALIDVGLDEIVGTKPAS